MNTLSSINTGLPTQSLNHNDTAARSQSLPSSQAAAPTVAVSAAAVQAVGAGAQTASAAKSTDNHYLQEAVDKVSKVVELYSSELQFTVDPDTDIDVVKVVDKQTKEVLRQIPSVEMLKIAQNIDKIVGLLVENEA